MLSWLLIPLSYIILYYKTYIKYFSYTFVVIAIIGIVETILLIEKYNYFLLISTSLILHAILLYPLTNIKKYLKLNISNIALAFLGIIITLFFTILAVYFIKKHVYYICYNNLYFPIFIK